MKKILLTCIMFAILAANTLCAFEISGKTEVIVDVNAPESTLLAAREFIHYTGKAGAPPLKTVKGRSHAVSRVIIGTLAQMKSLPVSAARKLAAAKSPDAFAIVCRGQTLFIAGKERVGELYGTYAFLEGKIGIRWFRAATAQDAYEYIPEKVSLKFSDFEIVRDPDQLPGIGRW